MKKKLFSFIIAFVFILTADICLTACGGDKTPKTEYTNVSISLTAEDWEFGYDYVKEVTLGTGLYSGGGFNVDETLSQRNEQAEKNKTLTSTVTYKRGYDPSSVIVTEKNGRTDFTKEVGTGDDANKLYIKVTPNSNVNYEFTLSVPSVIIQNLEFKNVNVSKYNIYSPIYKFLSDAQIYVNEGGNNSFVDLTTNNGNWLELNLDNKKIAVDMSQEYAKIYVKFSNVYEDNSLNKLFKLIGSYDNEPITFSKEYDDSKQAYVFKVETRWITRNSRITFCDNLENEIAYKEYSVSLKDAKLVANNENSERLCFEKLQNESYYKKYNEAKTVKYRAKGVYDISNQKQLSQTQALDYSKIKFEINGTELQSNYDSEHNYHVITLDALNDYNEETSFMEINVVTSSLTFKDTVTNKNIITTTSEMTIASGTNIQYINSNNKVISEVLFNSENAYNLTSIFVDNCERYERFTLKFKFGNHTEFTKEFISGTDFNIPFSSQNASLTSANTVTRWKDPVIIWQDGVEANITDILVNGSIPDSYNAQYNYIAVGLGEDGLFVELNEENNAGMNYVCEMVESTLSSNNLDINIGQNIVVKQNNQTVANDDLTYGKYILEYDDTKYNIKIAVYSNNILIASQDTVHGGSYISAIEGTTMGSDSMLKHYEGNKATLSVKNLTVKLYDNDSRAEMVIIDKIEISLVQIGQNF